MSEHWWWDLNPSSMNPEHALQTRLDIDRSRAWTVQGDECNLDENIFSLRAFGQQERGWSEIRIKEEEGTHTRSSKTMPLIPPTLCHKTLKLHGTAGHFPTSR